jgi:protein involved in polysaccharide export with SLBB domain
MIKKWLIALFFIFIFFNYVLGEQIQAPSIIPSVEPSTNLFQQVPSQLPTAIHKEKNSKKYDFQQVPSQLPTKQLLPQPSPAQQPTWLPSVEKPSEFEQYLSEVIEITDSQFEILKRLEGITFQYLAKNLPEDKIAIPIKVVGKRKEEEVIIDSGYLIGTPEAISGAFKILGIKSSFAVSTDLKHFGYEFFRQPPSTFAPVDNIPVGPEYVIGPGDEIRVIIWGSIEAQWNGVVDRDGSITLPKIGTIGVAGLTFEELKEVLYKEFSMYYRNFEMNVSMGKLRTIQVYVVGDAKRPGAYTVSSLSTLVNALFAAGGPSKEGSMRRIELKRNGETIVVFDMYDLLLKGDKTKDVRLMPEDVIFIPPVGPCVAIAGSVKRPAIYELKKEKTIKELIELAGGLSDISFKGRIQIERVVENYRQIVFESELEQALNHPLISGDLIKVFQVFPDKKFVRITGAIQRPGEYGFKDGMTVKALISMAGGLKYYAYTKKAELTRVTPTPKGPETKKIIISLEKALQGDPEHNILLQENDYIFIRAVPEWELYKTVQISGEVKFPGTYTIKKGEKLSSLLERAGGFTEKAYLKGAIFIRQSVKELQQKQLDEMIDRLERELMSVSSASVATAMTPEEARILQIETEQKRQFIQRLRQPRAIGRIVVKLDEPERLKDTLYDIELEEGDFIHIPQKPNTVQVLGSVYNQGAFVYDPNKDYSDYIELAGGFTENADEKNIYILKVDGSAVKPGKGLLGLRWNQVSKRWEIGGSELEPGDTIIVPEKLYKIAWMREIKDIIQILYQIAVAAGVAIAAF